MDYLFNKKLNKILVVFYNDKPSILLIKIIKYEYIKNNIDVYVFFLSNQKKQNIKSNNYIIIFIVKNLF